MDKPRLKNGTDPHIGPMPRVILWISMLAMICVVVAIVLILLMIRHPVSAQPILYTLMDSLHL